MKCSQSICESTRLFRWRVVMAMAFEDIADTFANQTRAVGDIKMPRTRMQNHSSQWIRTACMRPYGQPWCHTTIMVLRYLVIYMTEISAGGLRGDTEGEYWPSSKVVVLDLWHLPLKHQALIAVCRRIIIFVATPLWMKATVPATLLFAGTNGARRPCPAWRGMRPHGASSLWGGSVGRPWGLV